MFCEYRLPEIVVTLSVDLQDVEDITSKLRGCRKERQQVYCVLVAPLLYLFVYIAFSVMLHQLSRN